MAAAVHHHRISISGTPTPDVKWYAALHKFDDASPRAAHSCPAMGIPHVSAKGAARQEKICEHTDLLAVD
jgi:hypothetical protein